MKDIFLKSIILFALPGLLNPDVAAQQEEGRIACGPLFFRLHSPKVGEDHAACLDDIALTMKQFKNFVVVLDGHRGSAERKGISVTRVNFERRYLLERKIAASRIVTRNFGDTCPFFESNDSAFDKRVELWLVSKDADPQTILEAKRCRGGLTPKPVTDEKAAPWNWKKRGWTDWE